MLHLLTDDFSPIRRSIPLMTLTTCHMSISLDGFVAGPDQSRENPLGVGGLELHHWHLDEPLHEADARARDVLMRPRGAYVMGRNMFGPIRARGMTNGAGGGAMSRRTTLRCSSSPTIRTTRSRWRAGRRSTSSPKVSTPPLSARERWPVSLASTSRAAPPRSAKRSRRA